MLSNDFGNLRNRNGLRMAANNLKSTSFTQHIKPVNSVQFSASDGTQLASASADCTARVWRLQSGGSLTSVLELTGHSKSVMQVCWEPLLGNVLATCSVDKTLRLWDVRQAKCMAVVECKGENINMGFARDGHTVVVGNKKDQFSWVDIRTQKIVATQSFPGETNEFGFDLTGELFMATTGKGNVDIYQGNVLEGSFKRSASLPAHAASCYSLSFSPNGSYFAVASADSLVSLWSRPELACLRTISRFKAPARTVGFSHDSALLASGGEDGFIDLAQVSDGSQVAAYKVGSAINSLSWSPSATCLVYAADAGRSQGSIFLLA